MRAFNIIEVAKGLFGCAEQFQGTVSVRGARGSEPREIGIGKTAARCVREVRFRSRPEAICPKNMRGELAQARPVTFSVAATAAGTRIKLAWRETGSVPAHRPSDPGDLSRLGGPNAIDLKS